MIVWQEKVMQVWLVFLFRHAGVHFTGRPPCFTQQAARGRALSLFTPSLQLGGSKTDVFCSSKCKKYETINLFRL